MTQGDQAHREPPKDQPIRDSSGQVIIPLREDQQNTAGSNASSEEQSNNQEASN